MNKKKNFLRLVRNFELNESEKISKDVNHDLSFQVDMFVGGDDNTILVIYFADINREMFSDTIKNTHPVYILDMRLNPRFDIAGYSRKLAFSEFEKLGSRYMDHIDLIEGSERSKGRLIEAAERVIKETKQGPVAIIFGKKEQDEVYEERLLHNLPIDKNQWVLSEVP